VVLDEVDGKRSEEVVDCLLVLRGRKRREVVKP